MRLAHTPQVNRFTFNCLRHLILDGNGTAAMDPFFEIRLDLTAKDPGDVSHALYSQLKAAIIAGRLAPGVRLPATRKAAKFFGTSRNTATAVYEELLNEGYVVTRHGSGTFVAARVRDLPPRPTDPTGASPSYPLNTFWLRPDVGAAMGFWQEPSEISSGKAERARLDFRPTLVDSRLFPFEVFRRVSAKQLRGLEKRPARYKSPQGNQGNFQLRTAITRHIALTRAVVCEPTNVLVTSGAQQAFDLLGRTLVTPGQTVVAVEDPGYPPMRVAFAAAGAKLAPVAVDDEGLIVEQLPQDARVISLCPSHHFPWGCHCRCAAAMRSWNSLSSTARSFSKMTTTVSFGLRIALWRRSRHLILLTRSSTSAILGVPQELALSLATGRPICSRLHAACLCFAMSLLRSDPQ